jgi:hypothetical protein
MRAAAVSLLTVFLVAPCRPADAGVDCSRPASAVETAVCGDDTLMLLDRLMDRAEAAAPSATGPLAVPPRWRDGPSSSSSSSSSSSDGAAPRPLVTMGEGRLRALIAAGGAATLAAAVAAARPMDPLTDSEDAVAEEAAAWLAYVLTTILPGPPPPPAADAGDEVMSESERYAGFTSVASLPDGRLLAVVPEDCGAFQCANALYLLKPGDLLKPGGEAAVRATVDMVDKGQVRPVAAAVPMGMVTVHDGDIEVFERARDDGSCGTRWFYRVAGDRLALVRSLAKLRCDGKEWAPAAVLGRTY